MPVLCIGPVCIPLNLLLPFLLGVAHHYGLLKWIKREWVTFQHWRQKFSGAQTAAAAAAGGDAASIPNGTTAAASQQSQYVCEGGVCRFVPVDAAAAGNSTSTAAAAQPAASTKQQAPALRQRPGNGLQGLKAVDL